MTNWISEFLIAEGAGLGLPAKTEASAFGY
jgi:hypothetical protein